jgi:FKBP-type peptidyl-prolyl cis-trans isomerase
MVQDNRLAQLGWTDAQIDAFLRGIQEGFHGRSAPVDAAAQNLFNQINHRMQELEQVEQQQRFGSAAFAEPGRLAAYLKEIRKQFGLETTDSGLCYAIKSGGYGAKPGPDDTIVISCKVNKADANTDLPQLTKDKFKIKVAELPPGLAEGFQLMTVGSIAMMVLPPDLSYGTGDWPAGTDRGTPLIYRVKLHEIVGVP